MWPLCCGAQDIAGAADLQVAHGDGKAGAHLAEFFDRFQSPRGSRREVLVRIQEEIAIGPVDVTAHAAAKLVQIGQAVAVGLVDEDGVGVGDVQAALDDRRRQQDVEAMGHEVQHDPLQLVLGHLAVGDADAGLGHDLAEPLGERLDILARGCGRSRSAPAG